MNDLQARTAKAIVNIFETGTLRGVNALSGILSGAHGRYRYFYIILNHSLAESATAMIDEMVNAIAAF